MKALVFIIRGFHAGFPAPYGNDWVSSPALDRLSAEGVTFDAHFADVPDAAGARRAWRTGRYLLPNPDHEGAEPVGAADLLAELRKRGVRAVLIADGSRPFPADFTEGWDHVAVIDPSSGEGTALEQTLEAARDALEDLSDADNWLLWVEVAVLLPPWDVPEDFSDPYFREDEEGPGEDEEGEEEYEEEYEDEEESEVDAFDEEAEEEEALEPWFDPPEGFLDPEDDQAFLRLLSSYAATVSYVDAGVGVLLEDLDKLGLRDNCLVLLTGDHGLPLGEHGLVGLHRPWLYDELVHVPLLMRLPAALDERRLGLEGVRVHALTQSVDLPPTLLEAFGVPCPESAHGHSLLPLALGRVESVRDYACCGLRIGEAVEWCLRTPDWAYLLPLRAAPDDPPRPARLYVKPDDRWEVNDILQHHIDRADQFAKTLREFIAATRQPGPLQPPKLLEEGSAEETTA